MAKVGIIVDSTIDLPEEFFNNDCVERVCLTIFVNKMPHLDGTIPSKAVAIAIANGKEVSTTQPSPETFAEAIKSLESKGYKEIAILTISSKLSGTFNSARLASEEFSDLNIEIYDTKSTSLGSHLLAYEALKVSKELDTAAAVIKKVDELFPRNQLVLSIDDLGNMVKTGRVSKVQATIGNFLKIKPILTTSPEGDVVVTEKVRSTKRVIDHYVKCIDNADLNYPVNITHLENKKILEEIVAKIKESYSEAEIIVTHGLSAVVAGHLGIGALGMSYIRKS